MLATAITLPLLGIICVCIRLSQRFIRKNAVNNTVVVIYDRLDDVFCFLALLATIATGVIVALGASKQIVGGHSSADDVQGWIENVTPPFAYIEKVVYIVFILQPLALGFVKLSFLFLYRRIFQTRSFNIISWVLIGIIICWMLAFFFGFVFDCQLDFATNWSSLGNIGGVCGFGFMPTIVYTILDAIFDFIILTLPLPWIFRLQMSLRKKIEVTFIVLLGGFAVASAIVRMTIYIETSTPSNGLTAQYVMGLPNYDVLGIISAELFWTMVETGVAVIASCLPAMQGLINFTSIGLVLGSWGSYISSRLSSISTSNNTITSTTMSNGRTETPCSSNTDMHMLRSTETQKEYVVCAKYHRDDIV